MKHPNVLVAVIVSVGLIISSALVSSGLKSLGRSLSRGPEVTPLVRIPTDLTLTVKLGEVKLANGGGGGESFRITMTPEIPLLQRR